MIDSLFFSRDEFACKCGCGFDTIDAETLEVLEATRVHLGAAVTINSACRCWEHNKRVGGSDNSQHLIARACDIVVKGYTPHHVYAFLDGMYKDKYGLGMYDTFTHIDTRSKKARW